jgi:23S rRNA pseudouridine1911/1915/1917 synthase
MKDIQIIYENGDIIVANKPAGMMVHGVHGVHGKWQMANGKKLNPRLTEPTLVDILLKKYPEIKTVGDEPNIRPGIVHRLDKDTSGVMVVARNQKSFDYLKSLFQGRDIKKTYIAVVSGVPKKKQGIIDKPIGIRTGTTKRSVESKKMAKSAVTEYKILAISDLRLGISEKSPSYSLLEVHPLTGRTHQIRVHLTSIGHPIVGDPLYGPKKQPPWADRLMLHAASIEFSDSSGRRLRFEAEIPEELERIFRK